MTETVITIVGGLALFLFGMKIMSEGLQKVAGPKMRKILGVMTGTRLAGVGTGLLVTSAVQSSSATTVMLVGFVHAGLVNLSQSIGVIMGANIGTTFTGWLVAIIGFKFKIAAMALPAVALGVLPRLFGARRFADWGEVLIGFGLLFLGLDFMKDSVQHLRESEMVISWMASARADVIAWRLVAVAVGTFVTLIVQSSSATMAITMTLAAQGLIDLPTACALILGENIGTTVTANLAAIGTSAPAKQAARAHLIFNISGAIWALIAFGPFLFLVDFIVPGDAASGGETVIAAHLAGFHSTFNIINTLLFLPFVDQLAWMAKKLAPDDKTSVTGLKYIDPALVHMTPMALHAARNEMGRMLSEVESMLNRVLMLLTSPEKKLGKVAEAIENSESIVDLLQAEITGYMVNVAKAGVSARQSQEIAGIVNAVSDIERMGDHCESMLRLLQRLYDEKIELGKQAIKDAGEIGEPVCRFIALLKNNIRRQLNGHGGPLMAIAQQLEDTIDTMRRRMRLDYVERLRAGKTEVDAGLIFIDMLTSFEKIGDHAFNVAEMLAGER